MKVKLLNDGGYLGIAHAEKFKWDTIFDAYPALPHCETAVSILLTDLVAAGYDLVAANGGEIPPNYNVEGRDRTFFLDAGEAEIVEK